MNLEFKQLIDIDDKTLDIITTWMFDWWGKDEVYSYEKLKYFMRHTMQKDKLPQTYGFFLDNQINNKLKIKFMHEETTIVKIMDEISKYCLIEDIHMRESELEDILKEIYIGAHKY